MRYQSTLEGDRPCADCGTSDNLVWFTDDVLWNTVIRSDLSRWGVDPVLCVTCFVRLAEEAGLRPTGWRVLPQWPWAWDDDATEGS